MSTREALIDQLLTERGMNKELRELVQKQAAEIEELLRVSAQLDLQVEELLATVDSATEQLKEM